MSDITHMGLLFRRFSFIQSIITSAYVLSLVIFAVELFAGTLSKSHTFSSGTVISSSQMNSNFDQLFTEINAKETRLNLIEANGWITDARISNAASISVSKLATGTDGQRLHVNGVTPTWTTVPAVRVYNSANINVNNGALNALTFDSERFDTDSLHSTVVNTSRLTATTAGIYQISCNIIFTNNTTGTRCILFQMNGATYIGQQCASPSAAPGYGYLSLTSLYKMSATDYVECIGWQDSGGALNIVNSFQQSPEFMMVKVAD